MHNPTVNRSLKDKDLDNIDHALGRPVNPLAESYRNGFSVSTDSAQAAQMSRSKNWERTGVSGRMAFFHVSDAGRKALADHLKMIDDPWQAYDVTFEGHRSVVAATSVEDAKRRTYNSVVDVWPSLKYRAFEKHLTVEAHNG